MKAIKKQITTITPLIGDVANIIIEMAQPNKFEVGKTYWRCNDIRKYKVERKTKCFVVIKLIDERYKIHHNEHGGEYIEVSGYKISPFKECIKRFKIRYDEEGNEYIKMGNHTTAPSLYSYKED
jgi:hypothetical protein